MGRRSVNTTKSGKYMNPTDQARKEARRKELKKNKKQRFQVRHAVLKSKDPLQLLQEASFYDKQEFDPSVSAPLSERVIQDKRRKLLETFSRLIALYRKEDPEKAISLQAAKDEYDKNRHELIVYYEQVKLAERVKASEIPLPDLPSDDHTGISPADIPLPPTLAAAAPASVGVQSSKEPTKSILKKADSSLPPGPPPGLPPALRKPPGPPPGPPPELSDSESDDDDALAPPGTQSANRSSASRRIRFVDDDSYDPDTAVEKDTRIKFRKGRAPGGLQDKEDSKEISEGSGKPVPSDQISSTILQANFSTLPPPPGANNPLPPGIGLPPGLVRPGVIPPQRLQMNLMPRPMGVPPPRLPPGAVPNLPPGHSAVFSAPPSLNPSRPKPGEEGHDASITTSATTIEAKPQLKNLIGDATKFVPTAVKVRRTVKDSRGRLITLGGGQTHKESSEMYKRSQGPVVSAQSTGDAYDQFMKEMNELI